MDHEIMPSRHSLVPFVILARLSGDGRSRAWAPASACRRRVQVDVVQRQPISSVNTAVSWALRGGIPR